ncbi:MAG: zf-HC2 domain-containing protein [Planctomycetes bacterium]|nr:zf-HC2 domain-containing protein [Planctomycetota bacterium]
MLETAGAAAAATLAIGLAVWSTNWSSDGVGAGREEYSFGGIACSEVRDHLPEYAAGAVPEELAIRIRAHLEECPACQELMRRMQATRTSAALPHMGPGVARSSPCTCDSCRRYSSYASGAPPLKVQGNHALLGFALANAR